MKRIKLKIIPILIFLFIVVFVISAGMFIYKSEVLRKEKTAFERLSTLVANEKKQQSLPSEQAPTSSSETTMLPMHAYTPLYEENSDFFGWIAIDGTNINYPVMYSPDRPEYYLTHAFDKSESISGTPFIDKNCTDKGNIYVIYGHNMQDKTMFGQLPNYAEKHYFEEHPLIHFDTLYEQREYQVIASFHSQIYDKDETNVFRYYEYTNLSDKSVFNEFMEQVRAATIYDTGIQAVYGDELLMLSTCSYHTENGRFVLVAKRITNTK
ncbi:class B sortase [Enterococcus durans]|uniref:class B sortase n=1 Tax=Enterococcus durans TaxID=53345 RepID=UPI001D0B4174|nr:class B sortase [Enterococcus durans]MCB8506697.1 class B sortase [Enterococcus durans]MCB8516378.1 class B sortase [Enterococcus durans]